MWIGASSFLGFGLNIVGTAILARFIAPAEFGAYALAQSYNQIVLAATSFAFTQGVVQAAEPTPALADTALLMTAAVRVALLVAAIPIAWLLRGLHGDSVAWMFALLAGWQLIEAVKTAMGITLERELRFGRIAVLSLLGSALAMVLAVAMVRVRPGPMALVARDIAASAIVLVAYAVMARRWNLPTGRRFDREAARELWRFGKSMYVVRALEQLVARLDRPLVGNGVSLEALGLYHQSRYVASLPAVAVAPGNLRVAVATYSRLRGDRERTAAAFALVQYFVIRAVTPFAVLCFVWPGQLLLLAFGPRWLPAAPALRTLAVFAVAYPALESYRALLTATEDWRSLRRSIVIQAVTLVAGFAWAAPRWGAAGAAVAALGSTACGLAYSYAAARRILGRPAPWNLAAVLGAALVAVTVGFTVSTGLGAASTRALLVGACASVVAYAVALLAFERVRITKNIARVLDLARSRRRSAAPSSALDAG
jgi:PST family polysaccharide transporter